MTETMTITKATVEQGQATPWNKQGNRTWEAEWHTDEAAGDNGHRIITLTASNREGVYVVRAGIATREPNTNGFKVTTFRFFQDPLVTLFKERARFSQKRLKEIFDEAYQSFDAAAFYAAHEVEH